MTATQTTQQRDHAAETFEASIAQLKRIAKVIARNQPALAPKLQF